MECEMMKCDDELSNNTEFCWTSPREKTRTLANDDVGGDDVDETV